MGQRRPLQDWKEGDKFSSSHLQEAIDMLRPLSSIGGGGVTEVYQFENGTTIYTPEQAVAPADLWVRIGGNLTGTGFYYGNVITPPTTTIDPIAAASVAAGTADGETIVIMNKGPELGTSGHSLTETPINATDFRATWWGMSNETPSRRVAAIFGFNPFECS